MRDDTNFDGVESSGKKSATRYLVYSCDKGDSTMLLAESNLIPKIGDVHPNYTRWTVESISKPKYSEGKPEFHFEIKYSYGGSDSSGGGASGSENVPPWELGAQNVKTTPIPIEMPIRQLYDAKAQKWIPFKNTAGNILQRMGKFYAVQLTFTLNYKHKAGRWQEARIYHSINNNAMVVCNISVGRHKGRMMPFTPTLHTVYENDGKTVKWEYETVDYTIEILPGNIDYSWMISELNVGRLARFKRNGKLSDPEPIYSYTPWKKPGDENKIDIETQYGGIKEVQAAQNAFFNAGGKTKIPWSQVDENMPLDKDGTILTSALKYSEDGMNEYLKIEGFDVVPESWAKYGLPRSV